uniref:Uncharacterized protein n=1 Tax=Nothobranchius pienaari TaxID=704102 RepID=A0A1A8LK44_9TELE
MALILWSVLFRRQSRVNNNSEDPAPEQDLLQKTKPFNPQCSEKGQACRGPAGASSACHQLHPGAQTAPQWEDGVTVCGGPERHSGKEEGGGLHVCSNMADHRVPLPATELGGTALVTTKTL